jgi:hypothetical protein
MNRYTRSYPNIPKLPRQKKESWLGYTIATAMCVIVIAIWATALILALQGGAY